MPGTPPDPTDAPSPGSASPHRRTGHHSRRSRWWPVLVAILVTPLVVFAGWAALVTIALSGGIDELFRGEPPRPDDAAVVAARERAAADLATDLETTAGTALHGTAVRLGGGGMAPRCDVGQHNWKIDDDYDLVCDLERVEVLAVADRRGFRADMAALDARLRAAGWTSDHFTMERVLEEYWDPLARTAGPEPGTRPQEPSRPGGYSMDDLPAARYTRSSGTRVFGLSVQWAEHGSSDLTITYREEDADLRGPGGRRVRTGELIREIPQQGYAVVLTESVEYFRQ